MLPFLFLFVFLQADVSKKQIHNLIKLGCVFALANAVLGIVQYATGNYLWFAGPDEAEWQAYKTGLAKLSGFGDFLGVQDALPTGFLHRRKHVCVFSFCAALSGDHAGFFRRILPSANAWLCLLASAADICLPVVHDVPFRFACFCRLDDDGISLSEPAPWYFACGDCNAVSPGVIAILFLTQGLLDWDQFGSFEGRQEMISDAFTLMKAHPELLLTGGYTDLYHMQSRETQEIHNLVLYSIVQFGLPATIVVFRFLHKIFPQSFPCRDGSERT